MKWANVSRKRLWFLFVLFWYECISVAYFYLLVEKSIVFSLILKSFLLIFFSKKFAAD